MCVNDEKQTKKGGLVRLWCALFIALPPVCLRGARFLPERVTAARGVGERRSRFRVPCPQAGGKAACPPSGTAVPKYGTAWKGCHRWEMRNAQGAHQEQRRWGTRPVCLVPCHVHRNEVFCRKQGCRALLFGTVEPTSVVGTEESGVNWRFEPRTGQSSVPATGTRDKRQRSRDDVSERFGRKKPYALSSFVSNFSGGIEQWFLETLLLEALSFLHQT